jgi:hypothetical protein
LLAHVHFESPSIDLLVLDITNRSV